ncbi:hypothetical protein AMR41_26980, partial [Hapalosiphon sp. MRB220]
GIRQRYPIIGAPGSGKSAILAKYVTDNPDVVYYNAEVEGKNQAGEFLTNICTQLIYQYSLNHTSLPENATEGSWFLSLLLQQISESLAPNQKLIIAIDGLHCIDRTTQPQSTNLFYLPRYLPDGVYFLLTRRPFLREKSGLLIETPSQTLDLADYSEENHQAIKAYIQKYLTSPTLAEEKKSNLKSWLMNHHLSEPEFSNYLCCKAENNFMYVSEMINAIAEGLNPEPFQHNQFPPNLEAYYQQHLQKMIASTQQEDFSLAVLHVLSQEPQLISVEALAHILNTDEYEVEEVLENWREFLQLQQIGDETRYSLYHSSFRHWLNKQGDGERGLGIGDRGSGNRKTV